MLLEMPTLGQAQRVAAATGWPQLPGRDQGRLSTRLDAGDAFESGREAVEAVSVLFDLYEENPGGELIQVASGWMVTAARFEVEWPKDPSVVRSHFGGRRFAYNWALGQVKADLNKDGGESVGWNLAELRKAWNRAKEEDAPWWRENSKEVYSSGIADLCSALTNWSKSKNGERKGQRVGFPAFRSRNRDQGRVRFTTGAMRLEEDRRTIVLPVVGALRSKENTRRVQRPLAKGYGRLLNMTLSEQCGRLFVSVCYARRTPSARPPAKPDVRVGVDLGLRTLATVSATDGTRAEFGNPAPLRAALAERRRVGRQLSRRIPGSRGHSQAKAKLASLDRRAVHLRREAWHQLTSSLVSSYGEVVVEDLDIAAMKRSMGRRAFRRSVSDAALGTFRPMLEYKAAKTGTVVTVVDRWFPSSQTHYGCGCRLIAPTRLAKMLVCEITGELVDRDHNAADNLRDWPDDASCRSVGATAPVATEAGGPSVEAVEGTVPGSDTGRAGAGGVDVRPRRARRSALRPEPSRRPPRRRRGTP